jgi:type I restriction enzyme M protein
MLHCLDDSTGRMGIILPHGVLFRGQQEGKIRRTIIENFNLLDAVIGLPANLFFGAGIPACVLIFKKNRNTRSVFFVDASGEGNYEKGKNQNILREQDIEKIVDTYRRRAIIDKYSYEATFDEIRENDFNLNIPRYVDTFEEDPDIDITAVKAEIASIETELADVQAQMSEYLAKLGIM